MMIVHLLIELIFPDFGEVWMLSVFGIFFIASAVYRMARLKNELDAIKEAREEMEAEEQAMKAYLADKTPTFHKTEE